MDALGFQLILCSSGEAIGESGEVGGIRTELGPRPRLNRASREHLPINLLNSDAIAGDDAALPCAAFQKRYNKIGKGGLAGGRQAGCTARCGLVKKRLSMRENWLVWVWVKSKKLAGKVSRIEEKKSRIQRSPAALRKTVKTLRAGTSLPTFRSSVDAAPTPLCVGCKLTLVLKIQRHLCSRLQPRRSPGLETQSEVW